LIRAWISAIVAATQIGAWEVAGSMSQSEVQPRERAPGPGDFDWKALLRWSAIASILVVVLINVLGGVIIPPLLVFAVVWIGALIWLGRSRTGPTVLLLISFLAFIGLSAPFVIPSLAVPASAGDFILNVAALVAAFLGIVAAVALLRGREASGAPRALGLAGVGVFVVGAVLSIIATVGYEDATEEQGDVTLVAQDIEFQNTSLTASAGEVSVFVDNRDSTLHTFTIEELDVDLDIPAGKSARITFDAEPGEYRFFCVPHEADMEGTLQVD
jgi:plastocyanin